MQKNFHKTSEFWTKYTLDQVCLLEWDHNSWEYKTTYIHTEAELYRHCITYICIVIVLLIYCHCITYILSLYYLYLLSKGESKSHQCCCSPHVYFKCLTIVYDMI